MKTILVLIAYFLIIPVTSYANKLVEVENFGDNPGEISMYTYVPENVPPNAPLVVSLHGCKQNAKTYSQNGWLDLADEWQFYLVYPEQNFTNNVSNCWNWFEAGNIERGQGEIHSIIEMIEKMRTDYSVDTSRIYVEGVSAGGWLVPVLLAAYPDVFAGGATNAGGPAFCAMTGQHFWDFFHWWYYMSARSNAETCMQGTDKTPEEWSELVHEEGFKNYNGPWPILSIWHGSEDEAVDTMNQQELVDQWTNVHGIDTSADRQETLPDSNIVHREYHNTAGKPLVETWLIPGMAHGTPITVGAGEKCGEESDYILDETICAVRQIGHFWGLDR